MPPSEAPLSLPLLAPDKITGSLHAYQLSKRANVLRVKGEAPRCGKRGARINAISPGIVITPLARNELSGPHAAYYSNLL
ncbi:Rossmann-fold NAD(P)-binding domain-containing protein [Asaia platycodi]|uniref:SDR family oxidoreductase n=1 Tax=Asaia platycodi TaxID=610243 RepID=UPI00046FC415|nr:SDR family oxidoreductase [Asaia platycodi]